MSTSQKVDQHRIVLVRHARPAYDTARRIRGTGLATAIADYDACGIDPGSIENAQTRAIARSMAGRDAILLSSDLPRAIESAQGFFPKTDLSLADPLYREAGLPSNVPPPLSWLSFSFSSLAATMRVLWLLGLSTEVETYHEARVRADQAARKLDDLARRESGFVVLVGHGFQNRLIGRSLEQIGWHKQSRQGNGYGACGIFSSTGEKAA